MFARRFRNGDLLVPTGGQDEDGVLWDGRVRLVKGTAEHSEYEAQLRRSGHEVPTMTAEEERMVTAEAGGDYFDWADQSLREFGAEFSEGTSPDQVMVWKPAQVRKAEQNLRGREWLDGVVHFGSCLADTGPGDRGAVYETGGSGLVGFYDFSGYAGDREGQAFPYMAAGIYRPLRDPVPLDRLRGHATLGHLFARRQGKVGLTEEEGEALTALVVSVPARVAMPLPEWAEEADEPFEWEDEGTARDAHWASEHELHMRLAGTPRLFKRFGFKRSPDIEVRSDDWTCRYDIISRSERIVVEVKLHAGKAALDQVVRYLETLAREWSREPWAAHIVAEDCDSALRRAARKHGGVTLWECDRSLQRLERLD